MPRVQKKKLSKKKSLKTKKWYLFSCKILNVKFLRSQADNILIAKETLELICKSFEYGTWFAYLSRMHPIQITISLPHIHFLSTSSFSGVSDSYSLLRRLYFFPNLIQSNTRTPLSPISNIPIFIPFSSISFRFLSFFSSLL